MAKEKKSWFQVCKDGFQMYLDRDQYAYFYGAKGQKLTKDLMDYLWGAYPNHFKKYDKIDRQQIYSHSLNKVGLDCSAFVNRITGETGYSVEIYNKRTVETTLVEGLAGQFLFTTWGKGIDSGSRHIGIDASLGLQLDMGWESTDANIAKKRDSVHLCRIKDVAWEHSFQTAAVNYAGSYGTDPNAGGKDPSGEVGTVVNCEALNLRSGASVNANKVEVNLDDGHGWRHTLFAGEQATVINRDGRWYQIYLRGSGKEWTPWVSADYFKV